MTSMTIFMSLEHSFLRICNIDDAKVIVIDQICTCSKLIFQPESNKRCTKTGNKKHTAQRQEIKTNIVIQRRRNHKNKRKKTEKM
ncbi:cysteine protease, putative [Medicago truncatula]|uniref:Cysteine protease, putative n=1 Tax=Medicago truncatula TaxID=3880 RepID=G7KDX0_MEDTR|nr:cysteine protease, putative [Medicago truncatula]